MASSNLSQTKKIYPFPVVAFNPVGRANANGLTASWFWLVLVFVFVVFPVSTTQSLLSVTIKDFGPFSKTLTG